MSIREIDGLTYDHIPMNGRRDCALCGLARCRCEATMTRQPRQHKKGRHGAALCGTCWEEKPESEIRNAVLQAGLKQWDQESETRP